MDPRVGILQRGETQVFYGFLYGRYVERKTPEAVVRVLDGARNVPSRIANSQKPVHTYIVTVTVKYPAWDDKGTEIEVLASNAKEAICSARHQVFSLGFYDRFDGAKKYKARRK